MTGPAGSPVRTPPRQPETPVILIFPTTSESSSFKASSSAMAAGTFSCCSSSSKSLNDSPSSQHKSSLLRRQCVSGAHPFVAVSKSGEFPGLSVSSGLNKDCGLSSRSTVSADDFSDFIASAASRCSSGAHPPVAVSKSGDFRGLSVSFGVKQGCGLSSRSRVSPINFSNSTPAAASSGGATSHQNGAACSSSSCWGSSGSSLFLGDCGQPRSVRNGEVLLASSFSSRRKCGRRHRNGHGRHCGAVRARAQEEAAGIVKEIADLSESLLTLKDVVTTEYRAIGPEMRGRVERLCDRAVVLQQSADRAISSGSRIPTQLTANLIALQREHGSLENIVRLAMEASPALTNLEAAVGRSSSLSDAASNLLLEEAKPKDSFFQSLVRQSALEPAVKSASPSPKYVMSAPASQGSSPLAAFRAEIERRVIEQLSGKKMNKPATSPTPGVSTLSNSFLSASQNHPSDENSALAEKQPLVETPVAPEQENGQLSVLSAEESAGTVRLLESKLKELELELAKSIPLQVFEQKVETINYALSDARAKVVQLTAEVADKEAILAAVKKAMLAEQDQLTQKVRELTGDLEKMFSAEDIENAVNFGLADLEKELEEEQDRTFLLGVELEKKERFIVEQQENWRIIKEEMEQQLQKERDRAGNLSLELGTKEKQLTEQEEVWMVERRAFEADLKSKEETEKQLRKEQDRAFSLVLDLETKEKQMIEQEELWKVEKMALEADLTSKEDTEQQLQKEQDRALRRILELEMKEKQMIEQEELWKVEKMALESDLQSKQETEQQLQTEQDRALSLVLELQTKEKQMAEQEELWKVEKTALEADLKSIQAKLQDVRKKRTKERAQLAEKKQKVKLLEQELERLQESLEEADRIRLQKKEATYATVRMLITQMVQSSRARADSEAHASNLVEEVEKLQEEDQTLGHSSRAAQEKAGQAEIEIEEIKASLARRVVADLHGEVPLGERAVALEKFFGIMAHLIKKESENMEDLSALETDFVSDNEPLEDEDDEELQVTPVDSLASVPGAWDEDTEDQEDSTK